MWAELVETMKFSMICSGCRSAMQKIGLCEKSVTILIKKSQLIMQQVSIWNYVYFHKKLLQQTMWHNMRTAPFISHESAVSICKRVWWVARQWWRGAIVNSFEHLYANRFSEKTRWRKSSNSIELFFFCYLPAPFWSTISVNLRMALCDQNGLMAWHLCTYETNGSWTSLVNSAFRRSIVIKIPNV